MARPAFLGVGMPKCGTSTLHRVLSHHPAFFLPPIKEIKFFAYDEIGYRGKWKDLILRRHWAANQEWQGTGREVRDVLYRRKPIASLGWFARYFTEERDLDWYLSLFPKEGLGGDISPIYHTLSEERVEAIHDLLPDLKIIILLRSPLQQIWSHCRMVEMRLRRRDSVEDLAAHIKTTTDMRRTYAGLVDDWRAFYGEQILVGYLEDLIADSAHFFDQVTSFLGVADDPVWRQRKNRIADMKVNVGLSKDVPDALRGLLAEHSSIRLEAFETVNPDKAARWRDEIAAFEQTGRLAA